MSEQGPAFSGRTVPNPPATLPRAPQRRRGGVGAVMGSVALVGAIGIAGWAIFGQGGGSDTAIATAEEPTETTLTGDVEANATTTAAPTTEQATTAAEEGASEESDPSTTVAGSNASAGDTSDDESSTAESSENESADTTAPPTTADPDDTGELVAGPTTEVDFDRVAVLSGGVLYLRGQVPSQEVSDAIQEKAEAVLGADRVVNEYEVVEGASQPDAGLLYVEDVVLFPYGGTGLNHAFEPLLDLGVVLMQQNPQVVITVVAHTDTAGDEAYNLELSQRRAQQVVDYWVAAGVDPSQIEAVGKGESEPIADENVPGGAQLNRRAEFIITGLLD